MGIIVVWLRKILIAGFQCCMNCRYFIIFVTYLPFRKPEDGRWIQSCRKQVRLPSRKFRKDVAEKTISNNQPTVYYGLEIILCGFGRNGSQPRGL